MRRLRRTRNVVLRATLHSTGDRERAERSRFVWGERSYECEHGHTHREYTLSLLGLLNGLTNEPWLAIDVDTGELCRPWPKR